jgi:hypothetical protein
MTLSLASAAAYVSAERNPYQADSELLGHQELLHASFGVPFSEDLLRQGANVSFVELAEQAIGRLPQPPRAADLVMLAYALPDLPQIKNISAHANFLLHGAGRSLAVSEQGSRAPYTALRISEAFARGGRCGSVALLVLEQTTFPTKEPIVCAELLHDSAVVLHFAGAGGLELRSVHCCEPEEALGALLTRLAEALAGQEVLLVAGQWTSPAQIDLAGLPSRRAASGFYCTGVWLELARHHEEWAAGKDAIILCDTDPRSGKSQAAVFGRPARGHATGGAQPARASHEEARR